MAEFVSTANNERRDHMPVHYHASEKVFHLTNNTLSYIMAVLPNGELGHLYYGKKVRDRESFQYLGERTCRPISSWPMKEMPNFSLEFTRQEYPSFGTTDYRNPAFEILQENGSHISHFVYQGYQIRPGKPELTGLPHSYVEDDAEATTLEITLKDEVTAVELTLSYTIFESTAVIARSAHFVNRGTQTLKLNAALSAVVDYQDDDLDWIQFSGAWAREREPRQKRLEIGLTAIESMRVLLLHDLVETQPGRVDTLAPDVVTLVVHIVEDLDAKVGHADLVDIREDHSDSGFYL